MKIDLAAIAGAAAAILLHPVTPWQSARPQPASISGVVLDASTREPLRDVTVRRSGSVSMRGEPTQVKTDARGRFSFSELTPGVQVIETSAPLYLTGYAGSSEPDKRWFFELRPGEIRTDVTIPLWSWPGISGRVLDRVGNPLAGQDVVAWYRFHNRGVEYFNWSKATQTDSNGEYRLRLLLGTYVLMAGSNLMTPITATRAPVTSYHHVFYPSVSDASSATPLALQPAAELEHIDFVLSPARTVTVVARIIEPQLLPATYSPDVVLSPVYWENAQSGFLERRSPSPAGVARFERVTPGRYRLTSTLRPADSGDHSLIARPAAPVGSTAQEFVVSDRDVAVDIDFKKLHVLRGSVEDTLGRPAPQVGVRVSSPVLGSVASTMTDAGGDFEISGLLAGDYIVDATTTGSPFILRSVVIGGADVTDRPFSLRGSATAQLVLTDRSGLLAGRVQGATAAELLNINVLVFTTDQTLWTRWGEQSRRMRAVRLRAGDRYEVPGLPPGDYWVAPVFDDLYAYPYRWQYPDYLRGLLGRATRVFIPDGVTTMADLKVPPKER